MSYLLKLYQRENTKTVSARKMDRGDKNAVCVRSSSFSSAAAASLAMIMLSRKGKRERERGVDVFLSYVSSAVTRRTSQQGRHPHASNLGSGTTCRLIIDRVMTQDQQDESVYLSHMRMSILVFRLTILVCQR